MTKRRVFFALKNSFKMINSYKKLTKKSLKNFISDESSFYLLKNTFNSLKQNAKESKLLKDNTRLQNDIESQIWSLNDYLELKK